MATILSLALKVNADASGVVKNLTPAERALENLGKQASKATSVFDEFAGTSATAAVAQFNASKSLSDLSDSLKRGEISAQEFASRYADLTAEINKEAAAFKRAAEITKANVSSLERYDQTVAELDDQLRAGRISQETYNRALEKARTELDRTGNSAKSVDDDFEKLNRSVSLLSRIELGRLFVDGLQAIGGVIRDVANQIGSLVSSVSTSLDSINDLSARTGIGVEALQSYAFAAKLAGVDTEQFGAAVQKLAVNIGKATPGDALDKALKGINLSVQQLRALSPEQQFSEIGAAISQLPTAADKAAAAVAIFGKQGAALAPLFREGAQSIEDLQAQAQRLGIIVSETQINNVADMNDAFDKVRATVEGIIGQVIGNLAPAVTAVTNQFLRFVEQWTGVQGTGGNGIANAITDVLLQAADRFAGIFDEFSSNLGNVGEAFSYAADVFDVSSKALLTVAESFRTAFNAVQIGLDAIQIAFGRLLENVGSYLSTELEQFGAGLADAATESAARNSREMEAAAANAANTFNSIFAGGTEAQAAGSGAGQRFVRGLRSEIERARLPEVQLQTNLDQAQSDLDNFLKTATDGTSDFLQQSVATLETFSSMADAGGLTADQIEIMNGFMKQLNAELAKEKQLRQETTDAITAQAEADKKRLDQLMETKDEGTRIEGDLLTVQREQARVSEQLAAARAANNQADADAAASRQAELDQLTAKLEEQQQALQQGFGEGFTAAFDSVDTNIDRLIEKSQEFGQAGFDAAVRLQEGIKAAQQQAKDGVLNKEAFEAEVSRQQELFSQEIENIREAERERDRAAKAREDEAQRMQQERQRAEDAAVREAEKLKAQAARDRAAEENRIQRERQKEANAIQRQFEKEANAAQKEQERLSRKASEQYRKEESSALQADQQQQQQAQQAYAQEQARIFEEQRKAAEAEAKRQEERLRKLNTLGQQSISVADVRSVEGANLVLQTAAQAQDPALIQARLQTKLLERVALGIGQAASNYFNQPVAIVGAARLN